MLQPGSIATAVDVTPKPAPATPMSPTQRAGVGLTYTVLSIIAVFVLVILILVWGMEKRANERWDKAVLGLVSTSTQGALNQADTANSRAPSRPIIDTTAAKVIAEERAASRAFFMNLLEKILLNTFLPVLTGLLGYVFATRGDATRSDHRPT